MRNAEPDTRSEERKRLDEEIADEAEREFQKTGGWRRWPLEGLGLSAHPSVIYGVVENGVVRPLDPLARMPENLRVVVVALES